MAAGSATFPELVGAEGRHERDVAATWAVVGLPVGRLTVAAEPGGRVVATVDGRDVTALVGRQLATTVWVRSGSQGPEVILGGQRGSCSFVLGRPTLDDLGRRRSLRLQMAGNSWSFGLRKLVPSLWRGSRPSGESVAQLRPGGPLVVQGVPEGSHELAWVDGATIEEICLVALLGLATPGDRLTSLAMKVI